MEKSGNSRMILFIIGLLVAVVSGAQLEALGPRNTVQNGTRIVGGAEAIRGELPYQISLQRKSASGSSHICGGSILTEEWIVTAAHCVTNLIARNLQIVAGEHDRTIYEGTEQTKNVQEIIIHENYNNTAFPNDIALLKLSNPLVYNNTVQNVFLPFNNQIVEGNCIVSGWGRLREIGTLSNTLQKVTVPIVSEKDCEGFYNEELIDETMICAGISAGGIDACQGDSGGPMVCDEGGDKFLGGIVSWGNGCARPGFPGVYVRVPHFVDWINERINVTVTQGWSEVTQGEIPHQISLQVKASSVFNSFCSGAIVSQDWVVTSAHCVDGRNKTTIQVVAGEHDLTINEGMEQIKDIQEIIIHENYTNTTFSNDIALLKLSDSLTYNKYIQNISVAEQGHLAEGLCTVSGWERLPKGGILSNILQKASVPIINDGNCESLYGEEITDKTMICAGEIVDVNGACQRDSGGPLVCTDIGKKYLAGLASWEGDCNQTSLPGVYTRVSHYVDWINEQTISAGSSIGHFWLLGFSWFIVYYNIL